jgi:D-serine deaminase-like pyridoxal phosphate-dependent protein
VVGERAQVDALLERVAEVGAAHFDGDYILSAGGSTFFDAAADLVRTGAEVILRSGCYVVHDHGMYADVSPLTDDPFQPALELWTDVLSCPEPGRAIAGVGRRDAPYDAGIPTVLSAYRDGEPLALGEATVTELNDQHAFVTADGLSPGDLLCLGISHPCGAFDRWRTLLEVDADYTVTRAIRTFF